MFIGIFMLPFYLEYLGAEEYGLVGFFTMLTSVMMLLDMGLSNTLSRETARLKDKENGFQQLRDTLRSIEFVIFIISFSVFILIYFFSNWIATYWLNIQYIDINIVIDCVKLMGLMIFIKWFVSLHQGVIYGLEDQVWLNMFKISISTIKFVGGLILVVYISKDIYYYFVFQTLIVIIEFFVLIVRTYSNFSPKINANPSFDELKRIMPFAISVSYTSLIWIILSQFDKFLLSHYIPLTEYGYFALIVAIQSAVMQFSAPILRAILPQMVSLLSNNKENEMLVLYRKSTQLISIIVISIISIVAYYSYELLYSWTGNIEASTWAAPVLFWYIIGNAIQSIQSLQYNLQYVNGNMSYQNILNTIYPFISLPVIYLSIIYYGAYGSAISWVVLNLLVLVFFGYFVHKKFMNNLHIEWLKNDIFPAIGTSCIFLMVIDFLNLNFGNLNRFELFVILILIGTLLLTLNISMYKFTREKVLFFIYQNLSKVIK